MTSAAVQITVGRAGSLRRAGRAAGAPRALRASRLHHLRVRSTAEEPATAAPAEEAAAAAANGVQHSETATAAEGNGASPATLTLEALPEQELEWVDPSGGDKAWTNWKLLWALPWRRFKSGSVLTLKLSGAIAEQPQGRFSPTQSLPALCECLRKAALDPRIKGVVVKVDPLATGWGKLQELRRHVEYFRESGKFAIAYLERAGEKEYYLASAFSEIYAPPSASLSLRGMSVAGTFLRGALEKVGVEPEVRRIGKYKSAGDQLLREDMSEAQREQLNALLDDMYETWVHDVSASLGKSREEVEALLDEGVYDMRVYKERGFVTDLLYECELEELLKQRTETEEGKELRKVGYRKYSRVSPTAFGLSGGRKAIAVVRTAGAITGTSSGGASGGSSITSPAVIGQLRALKKDKNIAAVVLRIDSPGGDALASDLMWREIRELGKTKPIIASMADVAASGGYYMAMGCSKIVAERSTITGSIGVVTGKFNLAGLYEKLGYNKEVLSRGRYAQLFAENKPFNEEEEALFDAAAQHAYESFRDKAAESRGMTKEAMQEVAQGRVWSGRRASGLGLVDAVGGLNRALQLAKQAAGLALDERVRLLEVSRAKTSPLALVSGGGASLPALGMLVLQSLVGGSAAQGAAATQVAAGAPLLLQALAAVAGGAGSSGMPSGTGGLASGQVMAQMPDLVVEGVASQALLAAAPAVGSPNSGSGGLFDEE